MNPDSATICVHLQDADEQASPRRAITVFLCANCARPPRATTSAGFPRPVIPDFGWPWPVRQTLVSCTGRLQPEHVLKAFESGSEAVCMVACQEEDCHFVEGSKRCARRADFLRSLLDEIGVGGERLMLFNLPGTAAEDMALESGRGATAVASASVDAQVTAIRGEVIRTLRALPPNPLHRVPEPEADDTLNEDLELSNDDTEQ